MKLSNLHSAVLTLFFSMIFFSCGSDPLPNCTEHEVTPCMENPDMANLRVKNSSQYDYCNVVVAIDEDVFFGNILSGESSCYIAFNTLYSYAYIQLFIDGQEFVVQPIDFLGELPLSKGLYTYNILVPDENGDKYDVELTLE